MSHVVTPVLIDFQELRAAFGSRDEHLIETIVERAAEEWMFGEDESAPEELRQAIRHLIMGEPLDRLEPNRYYLAFESICSQLGDVILPDAWGGVRWEALEWVGLEVVILKGPPVALPTPKFGHRVGFLDEAAVRDKLAKLTDEPPISDDEDDAELLEEYVGWLREAASKMKSIVFFT